jgi:hypothetical protein
VTGTSLDCADLAASLAVQPVGLAAVEARLAVADPALFKEYQVSCWLDNERFVVRSWQWLTLCYVV